MPLTDEERNRLLHLARLALYGALEHGALEHGAPATAEATGVELTPPLRKPHGAFVSIYNGQRLRGCRGVMTADEPLHDVVMAQAVESALRDGRFAPVTAGELPDVRLSISVLEELHPIDSPAEIVLGRDGILLEKAGRRAVFLPRVAPEMGWDLETTLARLAGKAGLPSDGWRDATFEVFEAEEFGED